VLVPAGSVSSLVDTVTELLNDNEKCHTLGVNARAFIEAEYTPEVVAERSLQVYR
jgi:glycosyltransferase involved in cell wall biosynthesis